MSGLQSFPNPCLDGDYEVVFRQPGFVSICPVTEEQDVGVLTARYTPGHLCLEGFSFVKYLERYAKKAAYHEDIVQRIFIDLGECLSPKALEIECVFPLYSQLEGKPLSITVRRSVP